ncbi:MAG: indolepyruvate ferredoxin oxidoreductase subunit alpha [Anaerolineae bacterium]
MTLYVDQKRCTGCGLCVDACPLDAIHLLEGRAQIDPALCRGCEVCRSICPTGAISPTRPAPDVALPVSPELSEAPVTVYTPSPNDVARREQGGSWLLAALADLRHIVTTLRLGSPGQRPRPPQRSPRSLPNSRRRTGGGGRQRRARRRGRW